MSNKGHRKDPAERLWKKVDCLGENECWNWLGASTHNGYGVLGPNLKERRAHRLSWTLHYGEIPDGQLVLHSCDNRKCVNPKHLFLGTPLENTEDMYAKGREKNPGPSVVQYGENVPSSKISTEEARQIRSLYHPYQRGLTKYLAEKFGLSQVQIRVVATGRQWSHLKEE